MRLPFRGRFCSLAAASLLTGACGGRATGDHAPVGADGGQAGNAGGTAASSGQSGASAGIGGAGTAGTATGDIAIGGQGGALIVSSGGSTGGSGCTLDCASFGNDGCGSDCVATTAALDTCVVSATRSRTIHGVVFDCAALALGPNGYDFDAQSQLVLTGDACDALKTSVSHRIEIVLGCTLDK